MDLKSNIVINIYSIALLIVIGYNSYKQEEKENFQYVLYKMMLQVTVLLLVVDIFSRFDGNIGTIYPVLNHIGNFVMFFSNPILPSLWLLYVHYQIFRDVEKTKCLYKPLIFIIIVHGIMVTLSQFYGWFYYIDSFNIYHRGPLFWATVSFTIVLLLAAFVLIIVNRKIIDKKHFYSLAFFAIPPSISIVLQLTFYGISIMLNSIVLSILIVFLNVQNHNIYIDFLTGVNNRKNLEIYLKNKISSCTESKTFSAIMIDLNNFKNINDTFGHDVGDNALQISAKLLNGCLRSNDFIGRFGGDEFVIVLDICNMIDLEDVVSRINYSAEKFNETNTEPFKISFSMGYTVYNYESQMKIDEFLKQIDMLMYEDKHASKKLKRIN